VSKARSRSTLGRPQSSGGLHGFADYSSVPIDQFLDLLGDAGREWVPKRQQATPKVIFRLCVDARPNVPFLLTCCSPTVRVSRNTG
jgi:hypothetical protein